MVDKVQKENTPRQVKLQRDHLDTRSPEYAVLDAEVTWRELAMQAIKARLVYLRPGILPTLCIKRRKKRILIKKRGEKKKGSLLMKYVKRLA